MIRCTAFCLALDREHARRARASAVGIDRAGAEKVLTEDVGRGEVLALTTGYGEGFPVVHGWLAQRPEDGEFSMLSSEDGVVVASRDPAGTRPLYVAESGSWVSSDHRFFPLEEGVLLAPGSAYDVSTGKVVIVKRRESSFRGTFDEAGAELARLVDRAVGERVAGKRRVAVAFSGGLDSSILALCARRHASVVACTVHSRGSRDGTVAQAAADALGVELLAQDVDAKAAEREISGLALPFRATLMDRALWCIYSMASRAAAEAGAEVILLGQLADELFGGYEKYLRTLAGEGPQAAASMMEGDLRGCGMRGFVRDEAACCRWLEPRFPFADRRVLELGRGLPLGFKVRGGMRKAVLREAAEVLGVPADLCGAPKKAAQYSSGIQKLLA
ncbi:MAG TPA: asparagine synthase-related protein [Nitrososphaerales archaeon]|nr:asparagine synthase-related protein [Nitrososphaerales archaeon]